MKNLDVYKLSFLILVCLFAYILIIVITPMVLYKIPTTKENEALRGQILQLVSGIYSTINLVLGYKLRGIIDNKNESK